MKNLSYIMLLSISMSFNAVACYDKKVTDKVNFANCEIHAKQGDANAQYNLGVMYHKGEGTTQDYREALKWYEKAAEQGHASAQLNISMFYFTGKGTNQDLNDALKWYKKAVAQGRAGAQYNLGL
jgi:uncharacterized protein